MECVNEALEEDIASLKAIILRQQEHLATEKSNDIEQLCYYLHHLIQNKKERIDDVDDSDDDTTESGTFNEEKDGTSNEITDKEKGYRGREEEYEWSDGAEEKGNRDGEKGEELNDNTQGMGKEEKACELNGSTEDEIEKVDESGDNVRENKVEDEDRVERSNDKTQEDTDEDGEKVDMSIVMGNPIMTLQKGQKEVKKNCVSEMTTLKKSKMKKLTSQINSGAPAKREGNEDRIFFIEYKDVSLTDTLLNISKVTY